MPRPEIGFQMSGEGRFLNPFVNLEQMWMTCTDADADNPGRTFGRKRSHPLNRKDEGSETDRAERFLQMRLDFARDIAEKTESEMHLPGVPPAHAGKLRIELPQELPDRVRQIDRYKQPLGRHGRSVSHAVSRACG